MVLKGPPLCDTHPEFAAIWHPSKNASLTPAKVSKTYTARAWFRCPLGHEWKKAPALMRGPDCPACLLGQKSLAKLRPDIAKNWHPTKNGNLTPSEVTPKSNKRVWWQCPKESSHEFKSTVGERTVMRHGCPYCVNKRIDSTNSLASRRPDLAAQWHPTRNGTLEPFDVSPGSSKNVWWLCDTDSTHEWRTKITHRSGRNQGCPYCGNKKVSMTNNLAANYPEIASEWHPLKNGVLSPDKFVPGSKKQIWWLCGKSQRHEWTAAIKTRVAGHGCPTCSFERATAENCLATRCPDIAAEWHPTRNRKLWDDWLPREMKTSYSGKRPPKNRKLTPYDVTYASSQRVWWQCKQNKTHEWETQVAQRTTSASGCPFCIG